MLECCQPNLSTVQFAAKQNKYFQDYSKSSLCIFYLLASSLTLSISAINDTSLSTMLKTGKQKKEENHSLIHARTPFKSNNYTKISDLSYGWF